jgi:ribonuclease Z
LNLTAVNLSGVHELLHEGTTPSVGCGVDEIHGNEAVGMDIPVDKDGVWRQVLEEGNGHGRKGWAVGAGPIEHRGEPSPFKGPGTELMTVPAIGFVLQEPIPRKSLDTAYLIPLLKSNAEALAAQDPPVKHCLSLLSTLTSLPTPDPITLPSGETINPPEPSGIPARRLVIFGDCSGGTKNSTFKTMCEDASLLVHECTNSFIPELIQRGKKGAKVRTRDMEPSLMEKNGTMKNLREIDPIDEEAEARRNREEARKVEVREKAVGRGHSTPDEVGEFARDIRARRVVVNHFSSM